MMPRVAFAVHRKKLRSKRKKAGPSCIRFSPTLLPLHSKRLSGNSQPKPRESQPVFRLFLAPDFRARLGQAALGKLRCLVRGFTKTIAGLFGFSIAASASLHAQETAPLDIWAAAAKGDLDRLNTLLAGDDEAANAGDESGNSPLHHAAWNSQLAAMQLLLDHDADINLAKRPTLDATPLGHAQRTGAVGRVAARSRGQGGRPGAPWPNRAAHRRRAKLQGNPRAAARRRGRPQRERH